MQNKRYLVTGGTGFIGSALVRKLYQSGAKVRVLDSGLRSSVESLEDILADIDVIQGDVRDTGTVFKALKDIDCVFHLAALNGTHSFYKNPGLVLDIGVKGILNVIDGCKQLGVKNLFVASSSEVYQTPPMIPTDETAPLQIPDVLNPRYSYGGSKILSELLAIHQGSTAFDRVIIFRPHNVYGTNMGMGHVIPQFIDRALKSLSQHPTGQVPFSMQGDGSQTRAFTHIDDMIDGLMTLLEKGKHLEIYHIGNPEEITMHQLADKIFNQLGRKPEYQFSPLPEGSTMRRCPDISKIKNLGFLPKVNIDTGLKAVIDWHVQSSSQAYV